MNDMKKIPTDCHVQNIIKSLLYKHALRKRILIPNIRS